MILNFECFFEYQIIQFTYLIKLYFMKFKVIITKIKINMDSIRLFQAISDNPEKNFYQEQTRLFLVLTGLS